MTAALEQGVRPPPIDATAPAPAPCGLGMGLRQDSVVFTANATTMEELVTYLETVLQRPIEDRTGINGRFRLMLTIGRDQFPLFPPFAVDPGQVPSGPSLASALADDLNIAVKSETAPVPVVVIEHVERPTPN
jgi:uncharacterized protein (TIGR03435 family)